MTTENSASLTRADDGISVLTIDRPDRGNSVTPQLMDDMAVLLEAVEQDDECRAVVVTGTGSIFCSGADVVEMRQHVAQHGASSLADYMLDEWLPSVQRTFRLLRTSSPLLVAALNGSAIGGGLALALHCDLRVAARTAKLGESHARVGILPSGGSIALMERSMGYAASVKAVLSGVHLDAEEAMSHGLVDELVDAPEDALEVALERARELTWAGRPFVAGAMRIARGDIAAWDAHWAVCMQENDRLLRAPQGIDRLARALGVSDAGDGGAEPS